MMQRSDFDQDTPPPMATEKKKEEEDASSVLSEIDAQKRAISFQWFTIVRRTAYILTTLLVVTCTVSIFFLTIDLPLFRMLLWIWAVSAGILIIIGLRIDPRRRRHSSIKQEKE